MYNTLNGRKTSIYFRMNIPDKIMNLAYKSLSRDLKRIHRSTNPRGSSFESEVPIARRGDASATLYSTKSRESTRAGARFRDIMNLNFKSILVQIPNLGR